MNPSPQQTPFPFACQRWRDHRGIYRPPNEVISTHDYEVAPITLTQAKAFVKRHHYSGSYVACRYRYGLFKRYALFPEDELVGVAVFSMPILRIPVIVSSDSGAKVSMIPAQREQRYGSS